MADRFDSDFSNETTGINLRELSFLEDILEQLPVGVVVISPNSGKFLFANNRAAQILYCTEVGALDPGRPWDRTPLLVGAGPMGDQPWPLARTLKTGEVIDGEELLVRRHDQKTTMLRVHIFPIRGVTGRAMSIVMTFSDITKTKEAEAALRESEERYRSLVEYSPEPIAVHSGGLIVYANEASARLLGASSPQEIIGRPVMDFVPEELVPMIKQRVRKVIEDGWAPLVEEQFVRLDGTRVDVEVVAVRVMFQGRLSSQMVIRDITPRKRAERARQLLTRAGVVLSSTLDFRPTLENAVRLAVPELSDACLLEITDERHHPSSLLLAHRDPMREGELRELVKKVDKSEPCLEIFFPGGTAQGPMQLSGEQAAEAIARGPDNGLEALCHSMSPHSVVVVPLTARRKVTGSMIFIQAAAERRFRDEDLPLLEELGRRAAVAIDNARLYREMQEADRRKDEFLAMLAHELRNPLAALSSAVELLSRQEPEAAGLSSARTAADRQLGIMTRLLDDLLEVSRITQGKIQLRKEPLDLGAVIKQSARACGELYRAREHVLTLEGLEEPISLQADPSRLEQIFSNLLGNAAKYTPPGGEVTVSVRVEKQQAAVRVRDNGVGIDPEVLPHVFDLFVQGESTLDRAQGGLGIGLTLVRRLVDLHGGEVSARSRGPGLGAEFQVQFPVQDGSARPRRSTQPDPVARASVGKRILLVDDNEDVAEMLATLLRGDGHEVHVAHDGPEALESARRLQPSVVLLDIGLPAMDGYQVARELRRSSGDRQPLIIAITGYGQAPDRRKAEEAGFDHYLVKPVPMATLRDLMRR